jgi:hypothetical protein
LRTNAIQTFTSGKLNEVVDLFVRKIEGFSAVRRNQGRIEAEVALRPGRFGLCHGLLDGGQDELAGGAAFSCGQLMEAAVEIAREVDGGADGIGLHGIMVGFVTYLSQA